ncbi:enoyl-CoA hydratase-related protein [Aeromicrobium stalagmiti]|uniref:enoyl-CoA hydratase-related protein n=1 Tax=Aeromicrobium stalagmiti TaxID=2738988 RepID=UPI001567EEC6|nr:enoyl-CoA hydratase-related protein [Aeromicrobium stalagmiti]NRQ48888.1 enoyl-CoA hydratase/isomerase family protein [Aeromicrobium stalagmiti]
MTELVHLEVADQVATITLDSEHNRNALSRQLVTELAEHLATADADPDVRAVLVRSAGRVFCSGADLAEAAGGGMVEGAQALIRLQRQIATAARPVVVELGGPVRAGGLGIVGAADVVVAAETVTFALTEVRLGLAPAVISVSLLPRLTDRAAADLFLTARTFDAVEAAAIGLVTKAVPEAALDGEVGRVLGDLVQGYPQGLRETKKLLNHDLVARIDALGDQLAAQSAELFGSSEAREAMTAFLQRRKQ